MRERPTLEEMVASKCIHFNGLMHKTCNAGIEYDTLDRDDRRVFRVALPCIHRPEVPQCKCAKFQLPTPEEVQAKLKAYEESKQKVAQGLQAVQHLRKIHEGENWSGFIECPVCKHKLWVRHASNGHIWAKCETPDCIAWME